MQASSLSRVNGVLFLGFLVCAALHFGRPFFVPLTFGILLSMLMVPVARKLERKGVSKGLSAALCALIVLITGIGLLALLSIPLASFNEDLPKLQSSFQEQVEKVQQTIQNKFNIPKEKQMSLIKGSSASGSAFTTYLKKVFSGTFEFLLDTLLVMVYIILFLYKREKYEEFMLRLNKHNENQEVKKVLHQVSRVSQEYLTGRLFSIIILAVLYAVGLLIIGVKYAILLASIAALLTIVPFVGTLFGGLIAAAVALLTKSPSAALAVLGLVALIQLLDDYLIEPYVVGGEVHLSPLSTIVILVIGGLLWGIPGMIMFIPLLAIAKIVFDHIPSLQPFGFLIGDQKEKNASSGKIKSWLKKVFNKE